MARGSWLLALGSWLLRPRHASSPTGARAKSQELRAKSPICLKLRDNTLTSEPFSGLIRIEGRLKVSLMMRLRRIRLPLILLWALAHGVWMGAGWHAGSQLGFADAQTTKAAPCSCAWRPVAKHAAQLTRTQATAAHGCAVCELGLVAPEVPATFQVATVAPVIPTRGFACFSHEVSAAPTFLPPSRAPPVA